MLKKIYIVSFFAIHYQFKFTDKLSFNDCGKISSDDAYSWLVKLNAGTNLDCYGVVVSKSTIVTSNLYTKMTQFILITLTFQPLSVTT
jgi:hypothetical protein